MSTKADLSTLIDTDLASGQPIIATQHRNVLKDDVSSVLENIYANEITDTEITQNQFTLTTVGSATFTFLLFKQGAKITLTGTITSLVSALRNVGTFNSGVFESSSNIIYHGMGIKPSTTDNISLSITNSTGVTTLFLQPDLNIGETLNFSITYNSNT